MDPTTIITAVIVNILGVGGIVFYAGRKVGTICAQLKTLSENHSSMIMSINQLSGRVKALETAWINYLRQRLQSGEKPNNG